MTKALLLYKVLCVACVLTLVACFVVDALALEVRIVQAVGGLNVRQEPDISSRIVYLLDDCETVIVLEERCGWMLVAKNCGDHRPIGWACADYLN